MTTLNEKMKSVLGEHGLTLLFTAFFAAAFGGGLFYLCLALGSNAQARSVNLLTIVIGALLGWAAGMFFSPFSESQAKSFQFIGKTVGAFVSGYLLSKFEKVLAALITAAEKDPLTYVQWDRVGIFVGGFSLAAIVVFINRAHAPGVSQIASPPGPPSPPVPGAKGG